MWYSSQSLAGWKFRAEPGYLAGGVACNAQRVKAAWPRCCVRALQLNLQNSVSNPPWHREHEGGEQSAWPVFLVWWLNWREISFQSIETFGFEVFKPLKKLAVFPIKNQQLLSFFQSCW